MTTQEFVKKEAATKYPLTTGQPAEADSWNEAFNEVFSDGLTKGLEIAKEFAEWTQRMNYKQSGGKKGKGEWYVQAAGYGGGEPNFHTTSELLTIFLTEKYGK